MAGVYLLFLRLFLPAYIFAAPFIIIAAVILCPFILAAKENNWPAFIFLFLASLFLPAKYFLFLGVNLLSL